MLVVPLHVRIDDSDARSRERCHKFTLLKQGGEGNILLVGSPVVGLSSVPLLHPINPLIGRYGFNVGQRGAEPPSADTCTSKLDERNKRQPGERV